MNITSDTIAQLEHPIRLRLVSPMSTVDQLSEEVVAAGGVVGEQQDFSPRPEEANQYLESSFEPLTVLVCTIAAMWAVERVARLLKLANHNGLVIEHTEAGIEIREQPALAPGTVLELDGKHARFIEEPHSIDIVNIFKNLVKQ